MKNLGLGASAILIAVGIVLLVVAIRIGLTLLRIVGQVLILAAVIYVILYVINWFRNRDSGFGE